MALQTPGMPGQNTSAGRAAANLSQGLLPSSRTHRTSGVGVGVVHGWLGVDIALNPPPGHREGGRHRPSSREDRDCIVGIGKEDAKTPVLENSSAMVLAALLGRHPEGSLSDSCCIGAPGSRPLDWCWAGEKESPTWAERGMPLTEQRQSQAFPVP